jgi:GxxExxY protein
LNHGGHGEHREILLNDLSERIIGCALQVHQALGPGLLESACEACLAYELEKSGLKVERQKALPVTYREVTIDCGYRVDLIVADSIIVELKAIDQIAPMHEAQLLTYLKLSGKRVGLLINFNVKLLKQGIRRLVL